LSLASQLAGHAKLVDCNQAHRILKSFRHHQNLFSQNPIVHRWRMISSISPVAQRLPVPRNLDGPSFANPLLDEIIYPRSSWQIQSRRLHHLGNIQALAPSQHLGCGQQLCQSKISLLEVCLILGSSDEMLYMLKRRGLDLNGASRKARNLLMGIAKKSPYNATIITITLPLIRPKLTLPTFEMDAQSRQSVRLA
jgi:hypothetical protein